MFFLETMPKPQFTSCLLPSFDSSHAIIFLLVFNALTDR